MKLLHALSLCLFVGAAAAGARACPRGLTGPGCDRPAWPSCTVSGIQGDCRTSNTCECFRECDAHGFLHRDARICYNVTAPASVDDLVSATPLLFRASVRLPSGAADCGNACDPTAQDQPVAPESRIRLVPLHLCPNRCSGRGFCFADERCRCFLVDGSTNTDANAGDDCSGIVAAKPCPNACSGAGKCADGVCVCEAGRSGADCSLPLKHACTRAQRGRASLCTSCRPRSTRGRTSWQWTGTRGGTCGKRSCAASIAQRTRRRLTFSSFRCGPWARSAWTRRCSPSRRPGETVRPRGSRPAA